MTTKKKEKEKEQEKEDSKSKAGAVKGKDAVTDLLDMGSGKGYVTHDEIERHVPAESWDADTLDRIFTNLQEMGADILHKFTQKGDLLYIEAQARQNVYEKEDGTKNYTIDFIINNFEFLQQKPKEENNAEQATEQTTDKNELPF